MDNIDLNNVVQNLPNFGGMIFCIIILWRVAIRQQDTIDKLTDSIIKRENCD
jgi:hypothetical protein